LRDILKGIETILIVSYLNKRTIATAELVWKHEDSDGGYNKTVISILAKPTLTKIKIVMLKSNKRSSIINIGQILAIDRETRV